MGAGGLTAVADTGPLIHLAEIDHLPLLSTFDPLHVPNAVWREAERPATIRPGLALARRHEIEAREVSQFAAGKKLERLQAGELEGLYLCSQLRVPIILTDDLAVREAARDLALQPIGSLGIIAHAFRAGRIARQVAEQALVDLYDVSSLFVTRTIVDLAIERLRGKD